MSEVRLPENPDMCVDNFLCCTISINTNSFRLVKPFSTIVLGAIANDPGPSLTGSLVHSSDVSRMEAVPLHPREAEEREKERKCFLRVWQEPISREKEGALFVPRSGGHSPPLRRNLKHRSREREKNSWCQTGKFRHDSREKLVWRSTGAGSPAIRDIQPPASLWMWSHNIMKEVCSGWQGGWYSRCWRILILVSQVFYC